MPEKRKKIEQPIVEQKETEPVEVNFAGIFKERLNSFPPVSEKIKQNLPWELEDIKKLATALVFQIKKMPSTWDIWIENFDEEDLKLKYDPMGSVHKGVKTLLDRFLRQKLNKNIYQFQFPFPICAYIIIDMMDKIELLIEGEKAELIINHSEYEKQIISLYEKYQLNNIISAFDFDYKRRIFAKTESVLNNPNILGKIRELQYLQNFRQYHPMTNTQYARWLTASKTKKQGQTDENIWRKIITMDKTEDPTRRPDEEPLAE
ncbi:MAG: hypothetical protein ABH896_04980 [Candidatus Jacksonbacteria bacterium]